MKRRKGRRKEMLKGGTLALVGSRSEHIPTKEFAFLAWKVHSPLLRARSLLMEGR